jgi:hypothetical protein
MKHRLHRCHLTQILLKGYRAFYGLNEFKERYLCASNKFTMADAKEQMETDRTPDKMECMLKHVPDIEASLLI